MDGQIQRNLAVQPQVPFVLVFPEVRLVALRLPDGQAAAAGRTGVPHFGLPRSHVVGEVRRGEFVGPAVHSQVTGTHDEVHANQVGTVPFNRLEIVLGRSGTFDYTSTQTRREQRHPPPVHTISF
jgi:hypothetical protein